MDYFIKTDCFDRAVMVYYDMLDVRPLERESKALAG
jgi:hypothetical protein